MTPNKFEHLILWQYRELHEAKSPKRVLLVRQLWVFLGGTLIVSALAVPFLFVESRAFTLVIAFGIRLIGGNSASNLGAIMRRKQAWSLVEEITNWPRVYELLKGIEDKRNRIFQPDDPSDTSRFQNL